MITGYIYISDGEASKYQSALIFWYSLHCKREEDHFDKVVDHELP